jgi:hypothetical protein
MNLTKQGLISSWIIILSIVLLCILLYKVYTNILYYHQGFINYPQQSDPTKVVTSDPEANEANQNYAQILNYMSKNPSNSVKFIEDIHNKFFSPSCSIKSKIDFANLMNNGGLVF